MSYSQFAKRLVPFVLAFAAGLFVASFFVSISPPAIRSFFNNSDNCERMRRGKIKISINELQQLREENERLRNEVQMLREFQIDSLGRDQINELQVPPLPPSGVSNLAPADRLTNRGPNRPAAGY